MNFFKFLCKPFHQRALMFLLKNKNKFLCVSRMDYKKCNNFFISNNISISLGFVGNIRWYLICLDFMKLVILTNPLIKKSIKISKLFLVFFHQSILCWWVLHPQFLYLGPKFSSKIWPIMISTYLKTGTGNKFFQVFCKSLC